MIFVAKKIGWTKIFSPPLLVPLLDDPGWIKITALNVTKRKIQFLKNCQIPEIFANSALRFQLTRAVLLPPPDRVFIFKSLPRHCSLITENSSERVTLI